MSSQYDHRRAAEQRVIDELQEIGQWTLATHVAARLGWPWRIVARAMQRLAVQGAIESQEGTWKSARSRMRHATYYRSRKTVTLAGLPAWLSPVIPPVIGARVVVLLKDCEQEGRG